MAAESSEPGYTATSLEFTTAFGWVGIALGPLLFGNVTESFGYTSGWMVIVTFCALAGLLSFCISESRP